METVKIIERINIWVRAGAALEKIRADSIRRSDTALVIMQLKDAFKAALVSRPAAVYSGLVEQQRLFKRIQA